MKNPLGVSTLEEAASWLSEYSGQQWSAREVLDLGFKRSLADFQRDGVEASPTLWAALPLSTRFMFRRWTVERGCERRPTDWQLVPITYENVFALLCGGGSAAVEFPRASDPWDGEDGLCIDSPDTHVLVSIDMLRVYARDLVCLAAESTASAETEQSVSTDQPNRADAEPVPEEADSQPKDHEQELADLFDPVGKAQLEAMFPDNGKWAQYAERAARNGLELARVGRGKFNPYLAARWWINEQCPAGCDWSRCVRKLANNLPARSRDSRHLLTGDFD